jgi:acetamidase/formamidase
VAAELRISQVVDAPNWTVTAFFPLAVLGYAANPRSFE